MINHDRKDQQESWIVTNTQYIHSCVLAKANCMHTYLQDSSPSICLPKGEGEPDIEKEW